MLTRQAPRIAYALCLCIVTRIRRRVSALRNPPPSCDGFSRNRWRIGVTFIAIGRTMRARRVRAIRSDPRKARFANSESRNLAMKLFSGFLGFTPITDPAGKFFGCFAKTDSWWQFPPHVSSIVFARRVRRIQVHLREHSNATKHARSSASREPKIAAATQKTGFRCRVCSSGCR